MNGSPKRRIFIDTTFVRFDGIRSGIPRVAAAYVREALALAKTLDLTVIPISFDDGEWYPNERVPVDWLDGSAIVPLSWRSRMRAAWRPLLRPFFRARAVSGAQPVSAPAPAAVHQPPPCGLAPRTVRQLRRSFRSDLRVRFRLSDVLFSPGFWHDLPDEAFARPRLAGARLAILVHDVIPLTHPHFYNSEWRVFFRERFHTVLPQADAIFAISGVVQAHIDQALNGAAPARSGAKGATYPVLAYNGIDKLPSLLAEPVKGAEVSTRAHLLMVGSIEPKKHHLYVLQELRDRLDRETGDLRLTIVGRYGWEAADIVEGINAVTRDSDVTWRQDCDDVELAQLYREVDALIQASETEGFGLPMVEAAAAGCPIISSDHPVAREICPDGTLFFQIEPGALKASLAHLDRQYFSAWRQKTQPRPWQSWHETVMSVLMHLKQIEA